MAHDFVGLVSENGFSRGIVAFDHAAFVDDDNPVGGVFEYRLRPDRPCRDLLDQAPEQPQKAEGGGNQDRQRQKREADGPLSGLGGAFLLNGLEVAGAPPTAFEKGQCFECGPVVDPDSGVDFVRGPVGGHHMAGQREGLVLVEGFG